MVDYTEAAAFAGQQLEFLEHYNLNMNRTPDFLPPGFRFHPSDEELIIHYLMNKVTSTTLPATIITDIDLYKHDPWDLPMQASYGDEEWFFFTQRERKYPNGVRPNRAAGSGYWKATGTDKPIISSCGTKSIGLKKGLVFYKGRPPTGTKTDWIMHEYRLPDTILWTPKSKGSMRLDDWVLCRVRQKSSNPGVCHDSQQVFLATNSFQTDAVLANPYASPPSVTNSSTEMAKHYDLHNVGFPMLPYMLASHADQHQSPDLQPSSSAISFQTSENSCISSILDEGLLLPGPTESLFNFRNSVKRKAEDSFMPHCKGVNMEKVTSLSNDFNSQQLNSFMQFEGFNGQEL